MIVTGCCFFFLVFRKAKEVVASDAYSRLFEEDPGAAKELASVFLTMA